MSSTVFFESASELAKLTNTFKVDGVATDPTTVSLIITTPTGTETTYTWAASEITRTSAGVFTKNIACTEDGTWTFQWVGTGAASDTETGTWDVFPVQLGRLYVTVETLKSQLGLPATETRNQFELHQACFAASRSLEQYCQRVFYRTTATYKFKADDLYCLDFSDTDPFAGDLVSLTSLKTDDGGDGTFETTWTAADYELLPKNASAGPEPRPFTSIEAIGSYTFPIAYERMASRYRVEITGTWGWPSVPEGIKAAARLLAKETYKAKDSVGGVAGFGEFGVVRLRQDPMVARHADPYRRASSSGYLVA